MNLGAKETFYPFPGLLRIDGSRKRGFNLKVKVKIIPVKFLFGTALLIESSGPWGQPIKSIHRTWIRSDEIRRSKEMNLVA